MAKGGILQRNAELTDLRPVLTTEADGRALRTVTRLAETRLLGESESEQGEAACFFRPLRRQKPAADVPLPAWCQTGTPPP